MMKWIKHRWRNNVDENSYIQFQLICDLGVFVIVGSYERDVQEIYLNKLTFYYK